MCVSCFKIDPIFQRNRFSIILCGQSECFIICWYRMVGYECPDRAAEFINSYNNNHLKCFLVENDNLTESLNGIC